MPTVLLIEDDVAVRRLLRHMLSQGHRVLEAGSAPEAIETAAAYPDPIHLVITDVVMPQTRCDSLISELQGSRPDLKVILMSGYSEDMLSRYGFDPRGRSNFLQKPFTAEQLRAKIGEVLGAEKARYHRQGG